MFTDGDDAKYAEIIEKMSERCFLKLLHLKMEDNTSYLHPSFPKKIEWEQYMGDQFKKIFDERVKNILKGKQGERGRAVLSKSVFPYLMEFEGIECAQFVNFRDAEFNGGVDFINVIFYKGVSFTRSTFNGRADFYQSKFGRLSFFNKSKFSENVSFWKSNFFRKASFVNSEFMGDASFNSAIFQHSADFSKAVFGGYTSFKRCGGEVKNNPTLKFYNAKFTRVPNFQETKIPQDSSIPLIDFSKIFSRKKHEYADSYWWEEESSSRILRLAMERNRNRQAEGKFHALELHARRENPNTPRHEKFALWIYDHASKYGQSMLRPFTWLLGITAIESVLFSVAVALSSNPQPCMSEISWISLRGVALSMQQITHPFAIWSASNRTYLDQDMMLSEGWVLTFQLLGTLETLLAIPCVAMFILALRWQLRRG